MKLQEQYARLFKGKPRSNDVSLINEEVAVYNHYKNSDDETIFTGRLNGKSFFVVTGSPNRNEWKYYIKDKLDVSGKLEADLTPALDKYIKDVDLDPKEFGKAGQKVDVDVALKVADKMSYQQLEKLISVDDGSVDGRDREATGTIEIGGAVFNWTLETGDGMTAIYLEDESLEDDGALYEPILGVVNDEGYELEEDEY